MVEEQVIPFHISVGHHVTRRELAVRAATRRQGCIISQHRIVRTKLRCRLYAHRGTAL
jgi:hypothetical protein